MIGDISQFNTIYNWTKLAASVEGLIIRLGYRGYGSSGNLTIDKKFHEYKTTCEMLGIPYGVYFVTQAISEKEAEEEALFILNNISSSQLGIWLDSEYSTHPKHKGRGDLITAAKRTDCHNSFYRTLRNSGYEAGIYTGDYWINDMLHYDELMFKKYWLSRYGRNTGYPDKKPTHPHILWQYTSKGRVPGVSGDIDLNMKVMSENLPIIKSYSGTSISEALRLSGYDSSYTARKQYAKLLGIKDYRGTAEQNLLMLKLLS